MTQLYFLADRNGRAYGTVVVCCCCPFVHL